MSNKRGVMGNSGPPLAMPLTKLTNTKKKKEKTIFLFVILLFIFVLCIGILLNYYIKYILTSKRKAYSSD